MSRGRGRGASSSSLNREQLAAIGHTPGENFPVLTEAPPLFPPLNRKPIPLPESLELDYLLILRQYYLDHMQTSGAYIHLPHEIKNKPEQKIDKLLAQLPNVKEKFDWELFPAELRPKVVAKRTKAKQAKSVDIDTRLARLEQIEDKMDDSEVVVKKEVDEDDEDEIVENYEDEDIDDGTDYANNYFDNGDAFEDEDDNLDDGPIY